MDKKQKNILLIKGKNIAENGSLLQFKDFFKELTLFDDKNPETKIYVKEILSNAIYGAIKTGRENIINFLLKNNKEVFMENEPLIFNIIFFHKRKKIYEILIKNGLKADMGQVSLANEETDWFINFTHAQKEKNAMKSKTFIQNLGRQRRQENLTPLSGKKHKFL